MKTTLLATAIAAVTMYRIRSVAYGLAVIWAFAGILIRHTSPLWYNGQYGLVVGLTIAMLAVLVAALVASAIHMRRVAACAVPKT